MKKLFALGGALLCAMSLQAQMPQPLPMDPNVRYGHLENGLTYYIVHNELPEHHAEFYIAQRVGSVQEEESQRGLAHFLEHMAFNGLKNFPGKGMLDYLQRHGVKFGTNVNAYTSFDETVYNISDVPTDPVAHPHIIDSCLLMLHDWSGYISLESEEIDKERGVIHEEWRSRNSASLRMIQNQVLPVIMEGTPYPNRMPIGLMSVVDSFTYDELRNYYHKWYRPDLQALFVVGDIDVDYIENSIKTLWQDIQTPADAAPRTYHEVPGNETPLVAISTDPEFPSFDAEVIFKRPALPDEAKLTIIGYATSLMQNVIASAINTRLAEVAQKSDAPFLRANVSFGNFLYARTLSSFGVSTMPKPGKLQESLMAAMAVVRSVQEYGLTYDEVERVKAEIKSNLENAYNERDKRKNGAIVREISRHFLHHEPMPGIDVEWNQLWPIFEKNITPDALKQLCQSLISQENMVAYYMGKEAADVVTPTKEQYLQYISEAISQEAVAYAEEKVDAQLVKQLPKLGKVKKVEAGPFGSTVWTLSNGVKVVWKQTDFKKDAISLYAFSEGGNLRHAGEARINRDNASQLYGLGGVGDYTPIMLGKALSGKNAAASAFIGETQEGVRGNCAPKDIRTMFELVYLNFTAPRQDQELFQTWLKRNEQQLINALGTPDRTIRDSLYTTLYQGNPNYLPLTVEELRTVDYDRAFALGRERFKNAADFTFFLIGNINEDSLRTMCTQYLATLPASKAREQHIPSTLPTRGSRTNSYELGMTQPKTSVTGCYFLYDQPWSLKESMIVSILGQVLRMTFTESIREEEGGVYSPGASASCSDLDRFYQLVYSFETGADKLEHIHDVAIKEMQKVAQSGGVKEDHFQKVHDYMAKRYDENQKENGYWLSLIRASYLYGINNYDNYKETLDSITREDVSAMMARFLQGDNVVIITNGVEKK